MSVSPACALHHRTQHVSLTTFANASVEAVLPFLWQQPQRLSYIVYPPKLSGVPFEIQQPERQPVRKFFGTGISHTDGILIPNNTTVALPYHTAPVLTLWDTTTGQTIGCHTERLPSVPLASPLCPYAVLQTLLNTPWSQMRAHITATNITRKRVHALIETLSACGISLQHISGGAVDATPAVPVIDSNNNVVLISSQPLSTR